MFKITSIEIIQQSSSMDVVYLHTDLPNPVWPYKGTNTLRLDCAQGAGTDYAATYFPGIAVKVTNIDQARDQFYSGYELDEEVYNKFE